MASKSLLQPWKPMISRSVLLLLLLLVSGSQAQFIVQSLPGLQLPAGKLPFTLETGYVGVGESSEAQLFYYFVESERNPKQDPLMLWLSGGPGCSALSAIIYQKIGPFTFNYERSETANEPVLELNPFSWTKVASIIFLDQPVGTGFSYATSESYNMNDTLSAQQTYDFLRKWLVDHPQFLDNPLYVGGDSYGGMILPIIVEEIYNGNEAGNEPWMNIKGYMLGNPFSDKTSDYNSKYKFAHRTALLSDELYESLKKNCHGEYQEVDPNNILCVNNLREAKKCLEKICEPHILEPFCVNENLQSNFFVRDLEANSLDIGSSPLCLIRQPCRVSENYLWSILWANKPEVQEALNIQKETMRKKEWVRCNHNLPYTYNANSSIGRHRYLTKFHSNVLIYSGDHDMMVPYVGTMKWIKSLSLPLETKWKPWFVEGQVGGYAMKYSKNDYKLTYATVKGAGHTASEFKPEESFAMISQWFDDYNL